MSKPVNTGLGRTVLPGAAMIAVTFGLARYGYGLLLPEMQSDLGMSANTAGLISSAAYVSYLAANFLVVWLTVRLGPRWSVGVAAGLAAVGMAVAGTAENTVMLAIGVLVAGAAAGLAFPPYADIVDHQVPEERRALAWSTISSGTGWGVAIAGPIAIVAGQSWRLAWLVFVAVAIGVGVLAVLRSPARGAITHRSVQLNWSWFVCPRSGPLLGSAVLIGLGGSVWWAFSVDALREAGVAATPARIVYAVCGAASILASLSGKVFDRLGLRAGYLVCVVLLAVALVLLGTATTHLPLVLLAAVLFGTSYNAVVAAQGLWSARVFAERPSAGLAAVNTALTIGTIVGPAAAGALIDWAGYPTALVAAAVCALLALACGPPSEHVTAGPSRRRSGYGW
jgi:predicted MFS family arabinose efflux permease